MLCYVMLLYYIFQYCVQTWTIVVESVRIVLKIDA